MYLKGDGGEAKSGFHFLKEKKGYVRINKIYMNVHILEKYFKRPDTLYNTLQRNLNFNKYSIKWTKVDDFFLHPSCQLNLKESIYIGKIKCHVTWS